MKAFQWATLGVALCGMGALSRPALALPTMIRLGYVNCAACHIAPQGGGLLNPYGRAIDEAQSLRAGEYQPSENRLAKALSWGGRITQDLRMVGQETLSGGTSRPWSNALRGRFMYRNSTELGNRFRLSAVVVGENRAAPRPILAYDPADGPTTIYVPQALLSYRPTNRLEISAGRDMLPNGLNLPDLSMYIRARNNSGYYDAPTQVKMSWWGDRYTISPYAFAPGVHERAGFKEAGGGALAEFDVLGNHRSVIGLNALRCASHNNTRTMIGPYVRLGFGRWGIFGEHDMTGRRLKHAPFATSFRQDATYAQVFVAVREWLVPSMGFERLRVQEPYAETLVAPRFEVTCRLSSNFSLGLTTRIQHNPITHKTAPSVAVQLAMKTVN